MPKTLTAADIVATGLEIDHLADVSAYGETIATAESAEAARAALDITEFALTANMDLGSDANGLLSDISSTLMDRIESHLADGFGGSAAANFGVPYSISQPAYWRTIDASVSISDVVELPETHSVGMLVFLVHGAGGPFLVTWDEAKFLNMGNLPLGLFQTPGVATGYFILSLPVPDGRIGVMKFPQGFTA